MLPHEEEIYFGLKRKMIEDFCGLEALGAYCSVYLLLLKRMGDNYRSTIIMRAILSQSIFLSVKRRVDRAVLIFQDTEKVSFTGA